MKSKILHFDRLPKGLREDLAYDVRQIILKELDDWHWIITNSTSEFRGYGDDNFHYPLEPILPRNPRDIKNTMAFLDEMTELIELIRKAVDDWGVRYTRIGRY